jgi:hypothetical protein
MSTYGDYEPEDAWDPGDAVSILVDNLRARIMLLEATVSADFGFVAELDAIEMRLQAWRLMRELPSPRDGLRADQLADDLAFVRSRL